MSRSHQLLESIGGALGAFHQIMIKPVSETQVEVSTGQRGQSVKMTVDEFMEFLSPYSTPRTRATLAEAAGRKDTLFMFANDQQIDRINRQVREVI